MLPATGEAAGILDDPASPHGGGGSIGGFARVGSGAPSPPAMSPPASTQPSTQPSSSSGASAAPDARRGILAAALAAAGADERDRKVATKLRNYRDALQTGKDILERDHRERVARFQAPGHGDVAKDEERRLLARCKLWNTGDFEPLRILGEGAFGVVRLVRERSSKGVFALKQMSKARYSKKNARERAMNERALLADKRSRWFVELLQTFQDADNIYMVMEFLQGGDLMVHIYSYERTGGLSLQETAFYMAELIEAVDTVHRHGFVHRDLKPENIVFAAGGHLKLLDFGLCTSTGGGDPSPTAGSPGAAPSPADAARGGSGNWTGSGGASGSSRRPRLKSLVGTPMYTAPEVFQCDYGPEADLWAIGAIAYECLVRRPLFEPPANARCGVLAAKSLANKVCSDEGYLAEVLLAQTETISPSAAQFIAGLVRSAETRLTAAQCREEPFFAGLDFAKLHLMDPPWALEVDSPEDARYFDDDEGSEASQSDHGAGRLRLPAPRASELALRDRDLEWANYEFDARAL